MAAKGSIVKEQLIQTILKCLNDGDSPIAFSPDGKEIRVDMIENGNPVQIKIAFTAVKSPIFNNPESDIINEEQFYITEEERTELQNTLNEMGVSF